MNLQLFAEGGDDGGDGSGGEDDDSGDDSDDSDPDDDQEERKFTQRDVDDAVKKRLAREKRKWQREHERRCAPDFFEKLAGEKTGRNHASLFG